ncbi:MAG: alkaline phosphatase [Odoribacter sp.]|nr:alkaline phosphatase [Odoribacter sp.]
MFVQCDSNGKTKKAKYVFYFIGDGMGVNQVNGTEMFLAELEGRIGIKHLNFTQFPVSNFSTTFSEKNGVTCSAAAGTALATGTKTLNGRIGMDANGKQPLYSVAVQAQKAGKKVGITTSVSVDHATPAVFYAHQPARSMYYEIGTDLPKTGFDFYAGSGFLQLKSKTDSTAPNLLDIYNETGYIMAKGIEEFENLYGDTDKMILVQKNITSDALPYAIDRKEGDMTLAQITESAIKFLTKNNDEGFFLMVEGGKIDWSCHSNDAATTFREIIDFEEAIQKALDFYQQHPDETLIVITADHETGGMALGTGKYELNLQALQYQKVSKDKLTQRVKNLRKDKDNKVAWEDIKTLLTENLGFWKEVEVSEEQEKRLKRVYENSFNTDKVKMEENLYSSNEPIASAAIKLLNDMAYVGWTSGGHSAGVVPVYAIGAGSEFFNGKLDNIDIPKKIAEAGNY